MNFKREMQFRELIDSKNRLARLHKRLGVVEEKEIYFSNQIKNPVYALHFVRHMKTGNNEKMKYFKLKVKTYKNYKIQLQEQIDCLIHKMNLLNKMLQEGSKQSD